MENIHIKCETYDGVSKSFRTGRLERELPLPLPLPRSATRCNSIDFVSQSSEFCRHNPLCCFSTEYCCKYIFLYRLSPDTFGYTADEYP